MFDLTPGDRVILPYPIQTHVRFAETTGIVERHLEILRIRDLVAEPLTPMEFMRRPYIQRSRWLIIARDLKQGGEFRQFYLGTSPRYRSPGTLRVISVNNSTSQIISRGFEPTVEDRKELLKMLRQFEPHIVDQLGIRIVADDMRVN